MDSNTLRENANSSIGNFKIQLEGKVTPEIIGEMIIMKANMYSLMGFGGIKVLIDYQYDNTGESQNDYWYNGNLVTEYLMDKNFKLIPLKEDYDSQTYKMVWEPRLPKSNDVIKY